MIDAGKIETGWAEDQDEKILGDDEIVDQITAVDLGDHFGRPRDRPVRPDSSPVEIRFALRSTGWLKAA
jgi:hypothetical protein